MESRIELKLQPGNSQGSNKSNQHLEVWQAANTVRFGEVVRARGLLKAKNEVTG